MHRTVYYLFLLIISSSCTREKPAYQSQPDAVRDLLIDRIVWTPKAVPNKPGIRLNEHQFSITNTSNEHSYHRIQIRFDYYDAQYHRISTKRHVLAQSVKAGSAVAIPPIQTGTTDPLTKSATVRIEQAVSD
ncbi:hypothetical protein GCM10027341_51030 [Spirosoma knui]